MFSKIHRLAKTKDVRRAMSRGRGFFNPFFTVKFLRSSATPRFAVVVSTKVSKRAVKRNRLKRIIREFIRLRMEKMAIGEYAVIVKPKSFDADEKILLGGLEKLFRDAGLLR